jgi:hypothetical protein
MITYKGKEFSSRSLYIKDFGDVKISTISLESMLNKDMNYGPVSEQTEASQLNASILFYVTEEELALPDSELIKVIKQQEV